MHYKQSETTAARRWIAFQAFDDDSGDGYAPKTGVTWGSGDLKVAKAGAAWADASGTTANGQVIEIGGGWYWYQFSAAEVNTLGPVTLVVNKTDIYADAASGLVVAYDPYSTTSLGLTNLDAAVSSRSSIDADDIFDLADGIETGMTPRQALRLLTAIIGGLTVGAGTGTEVFRAAVSNVEPRATVTITGANRTAITYDLT